MYEWFSVNTASKWVGGMGEQSIRNKLNMLVEMNVLEKIGNTKSTRFRFKDPFGELKESIQSVNDS